MMTKKQIEMIYLGLDGKLTGKYGSGTTNSDVMPFMLDCDIGWFQSALDTGMISLASSCDNNGLIILTPEQLEENLALDRTNYLEIDIEWQLDFKRMVAIDMSNIGRILFNEPKDTDINIFYKWKRGEWLVRREGYILNVYTTEELQGYFEQEGI